MKLESKDYPSIPSLLGPRRVRCSSLRPGDWLRIDSMAFVGKSWLVWVVQNSLVLQKVEVQWPGQDGSDVLNYDTLSEDTYTFYAGRGEKRRWHDKLPKWLQSKVCPYSKPE